MTGMDESWKKRLKERMLACQLNMKSLSKLAGYSDTFVYDLLNRHRAPTMDKVVALADALGVSLNWLLFGDSEMVERPISGIVGAGQQVIPVDDLSQMPFPDTVRVPAALGHVTIVEVRGDSMRPRYEEGDLIAYGPPLYNLEDVWNRECVVRLPDGRTYLKKVRPGTEPNTAILLSTNADPIINVKIDWAAPLADWIKRAVRNDQ